MSRRWFVVRRLVWTVFAAWLVLTGTFLLFAYTPDPNEALAGFAGGMSAVGDPDRNASEASREAMEAYREARNYDEPVLQRYATWVVNFATLQWGHSYTYDRPVMDVVVERSQVTALYLVPTLLLAMVLGALAGLVSSLYERTPADYLATATSYVGLGLPNFWVAEVLVLLAISELGLFQVSEWDAGAGPLSGQNVPILVIAGLVIGTNLLAIQARYVRSETREYVPAEFVRTLRATGASGPTVARHVLRNAALPLVSLLFTEVLVATLIHLYIVEAVLEIPGIGDAAYRAIQNRDIGLILGTTMLVVFVTLAGNLLQDLGYAALDPRVGEE